MKLSDCAMISREGLSASHDGRPIRAIDATAIRCMLQGWPGTLWFYIAPVAMSDPTENVDVRPVTTTQNETMIYGYYLAAALLHMGLGKNPYTHFDDKLRNAIGHFVTKETIKLVMEAP